MREIKFRGKVADEWVIGYFAGDETITQKKPHKNSKCCGYGAFTVNKETVGQYTGLKDKNGNEIYEGDIVRNTLFGRLADKSKYKNEEEFDSIKEDLIKNSHCIFDDEYQFHRNIHIVVEWCHNGFFPFATCLGCSPEIDNNKVEIIGNVYDNPELINSRGD